MSITRKISPAAIQIAFEELRPFHPIQGIDYFVMKQNNLPVGKSEEFDVIGEVAAFMRAHFKVIEDSDKFARVFSYGRVRGKNWVDKRYPSAGLQSSRTREFSNAFIHEKNSQIWGFTESYLEVFKSFLPVDKDTSETLRFPLFSMAIWLLKDLELKNIANFYDMLNWIIQKYNITEEELETLFDTSVNSKYYEISLFSDSYPSQEFYISLLGSPGDISVVETGLIDFLNMHNVGLIDNIEIKFAKRFNLITGDNGLGKTMILDCAWWALSGNWPSSPAISLRDPSRSSQITFNISGRQALGNLRRDRENVGGDLWDIIEGQRAKFGLAIYMSFDGSIHIYDPEQAEYRNIFMSLSEVWRGYNIPVGRENNVKLCEGIISDLATWIRNGRNEIKIFNRVLREFSPDAEFKYEIISANSEAGGLVRSVFITHPLGNVPLDFAPAGVKKVLTLCYAIVWSWMRHGAARRKNNIESAKNISILIDEIETHLHPKWQKRIARSLLSLSDAISENIQCQYLISTHSPLVNVGLEPHISLTKDTVFSLKSETGSIELVEEENYIKGNVNSTLTSIYELESAESDEATDLKRSLSDTMSIKDCDPSVIQQLTLQMRRLISTYDPIWVQWRYFAQKYGVNV